MRSSACWWRTYCHQCGNCPAAAIIAEDLVANYEGQISAMAIHAGNLANTDDDYFDTDWTTEEGDAFWDQLDFQANPVGRINRINGIGSFWAPAQWEEKAVEEMNLNPVLGLQYDYEWVPANGHLNLHLHGTFYDDVSGPIQVAWLIFESHLFDYQLDYSADPEVVADYEFNHVLRGLCTVPWASDLGMPLEVLRPGMSPLNRLRSLGMRRG